MDELREAVKTTGYKVLAARLGVRYQAIQNWIKVGRVPAERVIPVEKVTGIPRETLRPDIYPPEDRAA